MLFIAVSAILFQRSATSAWAEAYGTNGHRLLISPIGIQDWGPDSDMTPRAECRWWPKLGDAALCSLAPDGEAGFASVRRAYPLTFIALWTSVLALFLVALRLPRQMPWAGTMVGATVPVLGVIALREFAVGFYRAFAVLEGARTTVHPFGFGAAFLGTFLMALAVGLLVTSSILKRS